MSYALDALTHDPVLREHAERSRLARKRDSVAAELRAGHVERLAELDEGAREFVKQMSGRRPTSPAASDTTVDVSDLDADLIGAAGLANAHGRRLDAAIQANIEAGYGDFLAGLDPETRADLLARPDVSPEVRRRFADRSVVANEVTRGPKGQAPPQPQQPKPELTGTALIEQGAAEWLARFNAPKRTRRR